MKTEHLSAGDTYATGYAEGRQAAETHAEVAANPFRPGSPAYHGWNDGHYDERSARRREIERHNAQLWTTVETG